MTSARHIIDITFCGMILSLFYIRLLIFFCLIYFFFGPVGDWAGSSYATSGCPGTCAQRLMSAENFVVRLPKKIK